MSAIIQTSSRLLPLMVGTLFLVTLCMAIPITSFDMIATYMGNTSQSPADIGAFDFRVFKEPLIPFIASIAGFLLSIGLSANSD